MNNQIQSFFNSFYTESLAPNLLQKKLEKEIKPICESMNIAKIAVSANTTDSIYDKGISVKNYVLYEKMFSMGDDVVSIHQNIPNVGNFTFSAYCVKKSTWSEDEKSDISFLLQLIYVLFSRSRMNKMLLRAQETDTLTGALNTAGIIRLGNMIAEKKLLQRFTVVFFNIKKFRQINDVVGSKNGDVILSSYVKMTTNFLGKDGSIARLGGDNFVTIVKSYRLGDYLKFLENVRITVDCEGAKKTAIINVKAGIAQGNPMVQVYEQLMGCAATAFKVAKSSQLENFVFFKPEMMQRR